MFGASDQQNGDCISVHYAQVVLLIIDPKTQHVSVVMNRCRHIVKGQFWQRLPQAVRLCPTAAWGVLVLVVALSEPQYVPIGITDFKHLHLDPVDPLNVTRRASASLHR